MSIKNIEVRKIKPTHPGEMLREDFMPDYKLTTTSLAQKLEVSRQTVNAIENGKYDPSLPLAFGIARLFELWIEDVFDPDGNSAPGPT